MLQSLISMGDISVVQLITICAISNGFVFAFLLLQKSENRFANRFLSLMIICMCLSFTPYMIDPSVWHTHRWLAWLPFSLSYWIGPSFYFYIRIITNPLRSFKPSDFWHFSPIVFNYVHSGYHGILGNHNPWPWFHHIAELLESVAIVSILIYMVICLQMIKHHQAQLYDSVSNTEKLDLQWAKQIIFVIIISFVIILIFLFVSTGISGMYLFDQWNEYRFSVLLIYACVLYWLSIYGYQQAQTFKIPIPESSTKPIPPGESEKVISNLCALMNEEKIYRNPELNLRSLSKAANISERLISETINNVLHKNFHQFVNEYRVVEIQEKLKNPKYSNLKILSLALDSGFNSKATFNRIFKEHTGLTPKQFKSQNIVK